MSNHVMGERMHIIILILVFCCTFFNFGFNDLSSHQKYLRKANFKILVFSKTEGFRHDNIEYAQSAIIDLGGKQGFLVDLSEDSKVFSYEKLVEYQAVIFLNTTGNILNEEQKNSFKEYIRDGGGFVGLHAAADTEYDWEWYGNLIGAYFKNHPKPQKADLAINNHDLFTFLDTFPDPWSRFDEWYNFNFVSEDLNVLMSLNEESYLGGENGEFHPIVWFHDFDGGRSIYIGLGHTEESYDEPLFLALLYNGILYAAGR